jgi:hypothetical protein
MSEIKLASDNSTLRRLRLRRAAVWTEDEMAADLLARIIEEAASGRFGIR